MCAKPAAVPGSKAEPEQPQNIASISADKHIIEVYGPELKGAIFNLSSVTQGAPKK